MMVQDGSGQWSGEVHCDEPACPKWLSQEKIKRRGLLERGWFCVFGRQYCADHHKNDEWVEANLGKEAVPYAQGWRSRQLAFYKEAGILPSTNAA